jgi:hypothetical protein
MQELESGVTDKDASVALMVADDVKDAKGIVVVRKGTPAKAKVTWSRREGTLSGLVNQPARLQIDLQSISTVDGQSVDLSAAKEKDEEFDLTRGNTGKTPIAEKLEQLAKDPSKEQVLRQIETMFKEGKAPDLTQPEGKAQFAQIVKDMGLEQTHKLVEEGQMGKAQELVSRIREGATLTALATGGTLAAAGAVLELANVAGHVGSRFGRILHGRNIKAYVGTPVPAFVQKAVVVKVPPSS